MAFLPCNELEEQLLAAQNGDISGEAFMEVLASSEVFLPIKDAPQGEEIDRAEAIPMSLETEHGTECVVVFTSPERARDFVAKVEDFSGGVLLPFQQVLVQLLEGNGLSLNPECEAGFDLEPDTLKSLFNG